MEYNLNDSLEEKILDKYLRIDVNITENCRIEPDHIPGDEEQKVEDENTQQLENPNPNVENFKPVIKKRKYNKSEIEHLKRSLKSQIGQDFNSNLIGGAINILNLSLQILVGFCYFGWKTFMLFIIIKVDDFVMKREEALSAKLRREDAKKNNNKSEIDPSFIIQ